jgi:hypothetical protein
MTVCRKLRFFAFLFVLVCSGCCFHSDQTGTAAVKASGILGQNLWTAQNLDLVRDRHKRILLLVAKDIPLSTRQKRIGVVEANTRLRLNRVVKITELVAWMWLPVYYSWDCTLAEIEDGPHVGKEVGVDGKALVYMHNTATLHGIFLTNGPAIH